MADRRGLGTYITDEEELTTGSLDYFTVPLPENVLRSGTNVEICLANTLTDTGPYEFHINADPEHYIYLPLTRLHIELKIPKVDGENWVAADNATRVAYCNLLPHALFRQIEIDVNGVPVNDLSSSMYPIKAFMETILSYGKEAAETHLSMAGFGKDNAGYEEDLTQNTIFTTRTTAIKANNPFFFNITLHCDFMQLERYILPDTKITLKLIRNWPTYPLISATSVARIDIKDLKLYIHKVKIDEDYDKSIEARLIKEPALFPMIQSKLKSFLIQAGTQTISLSNIVNGKLPRSLVIGFLHADAHNGNLSKNPFLFSHFNLNYLNLKINGSPHHPKPIQPDYTSGDFIREYRRLLDHTGVHHGNNCINITLNDFKHNMNFYPFDFSPDLCNAAHIHAPKSGYIDVDLKWSAALTHNIYMILYASYNQTITLDSKRNVKVLE